jgi:hypothetical protein
MMLTFAYIAQIAASVLRRYHIGIASVFLAVVPSLIKVNGSSYLTKDLQNTNKYLIQATNMGATQ